MTSVSATPTTAMAASRALTDASNAALVDRARVGRVVGWLDDDALLDTLAGLSSSTGVVRAVDEVLRFGGIRRNSTVAELNDETPSVQLRTIAIH
jgi:hypothetical protein